METNKELITEAVKHEEREGLKGCELHVHPNLCAWCGDEWPCITRRLADALEAATAAAGVTPQEPGERAALLAEVDAAKVRPALHDIPDLLFRVRAALAAPVEVDEAKLAEMLKKHRHAVYEWAEGDGCLCGITLQGDGGLKPGPEEVAEHISSVVAEWLRGGGQ